MARMSDDMEIDNPKEFNLQKYYEYRREMNRIAFEPSDAHMYASISHGGYSTLQYMIPGNVKIIMKCQEKMLTLTLEQLNILSRIFMHKEACSDYLSLIA